MTNTRRVIRKTQPSRLRQLDDQIWPLVIALGVLGGFLAGSVLAYLRLDDPRWYANAWTYLIAISLVITASLVILAWTGNRWLRRTMQLAVVLCTIFHIVLFIAAIETDVFARVWTEVLTSSQPTPQKQRVEAPQYTSWHHDPRQRLQDEFNKPVETELPDPVVEPTPRETLEEQSADVAVQPQSLPESRPAAQPNVVRRQQLNQSMPRQSRERSQLSRREAEMPPRADQRVPVPQSVPRPERQPDVARPARSSPAKRAAALAAQRSSPSPTVPAATVNRESPTARKSETADTPQRVAAAAATLPRSTRRPERTSRTDVVVADQPAVAQRSDPPAPEPNNTLARKQQSRSNQQRQQVNLPRQTLERASVSRRRDLQQPAPRQDSLAQTPRSADRRNARLTTRPDVTSQAELADSSISPQPAVAARQPAAQDLTGQRTAVEPPIDRRPRMPSTASQTGPTRTSQATPTRTNLVDSRPDPAPINAVMPGRQPARSTALGATAQRASPVDRETTAQDPAPPAPRALAATRAEPVERAAGNTSNEPRFPSVERSGAATPPQVARRQVPRRSNATAPSISSSMAVDRPPRRSTQVAASPATPRVAENPVASAASQRALAVAAPSAMALSKAERGVAGRGATINLGSTDPAADGPASVASGSAQRADPVQSMTKGPALAPQAPALVRDGRAGARQPSAVLKATPMTPATLSGSRNPGDVNASASAALTEAASDAERGQLTAAKGSLEIDLGPTTRVAQGGSGRASGGGQPQRAPGTAPRGTPRTQARAPTASLLAEDVRPQTAAPLSDGGGAASLTQWESNPNAAIDGRQAKRAPTIGGPAASEGGDVAASTHSMTPSARRASIGSDGPQLSDESDPVAATGRVASRNRQLEGQTSVADLAIGAADDRNQSDTPAPRLAADSSAAALSKETAGNVVQRGGNNRLEDVAEAEARSPSETMIAARAEAVEARDGPPIPGGGTAMPQRAAVGPPVQTTTRAELVLVEGAPNSSGREDAEPQSTQGHLLTRLAGGVDAPRSAAEVEAAPADLAARGAVGAGSEIGAAERAELSPEIATQDAASSGLASPLAKRSHRVAPLSSPMADVPAEPTDGSRSSVADPWRPGPLAEAPSRGALSRLTGAAMPVLVDSLDGPGGLDQQITVEVGIQDRRASDVSAQVQLHTPRFARQRVGGMPDLNISAALAAEPFRRRARREQAVGDPAVGAGPETEEAIELGLVFLSQIQTPDGRWTLDQNADEDGPPQMASDTAATGLALLAFQGAGYNHREYRYANVVRGGIDFLVGSQQPDGDLYVSMDAESNRVVALYSHSIAALALCEAYGMTQDAQLREPAQKALDFIVQSQHPDRGGWRYSPGVGSDTSVTGWMMMALKSGELAKLDVPEDTYQRIRDWLDRAQASPSQPHLYCYNPYAPDTPEQRGGRRPTRTMTSVGLLMRLYSGWRRDNPSMARGADYLLEYPPAVGTTLNPRRDTYYWYYATQVMFHMGGSYWNAWNQRLHPLLVSSQIRDGQLAGSWDPRRPVPDRWAPFAGRLYVTTMNLLSLEVTYRYLPLYEDTAR